ncbi:MAG: Ig-like domain-containing protein [Pseudomonadota bacterium]
MLDKYQDEANLKLDIAAKPVIHNGTVLFGVVAARNFEDVAEHAVSQVYVPNRADLKRKFLHRWARQNMRRIAAGLGALTLVLPFAGAAAAQEAANVDLNTIDGVADASLDANGDLVVTLDNGKKVLLSEGSFAIGADGQILVATATADQIAAATLVAESAGGGGVALAALAGAGVLVAAGASGDDSDDNSGSTSSGGGSAPTTPSSPTTGFVVDGYLSGATVFGDLNDNGVLDAGETSTTTAADGSFDKDLFSADVPLVATGGIDITTGQEFTGSLKAPAGSEVITPLTTLVQSLIDADTTGTPPTAQEAAQTVADALGLSGDILNDDPAELAENGDISQLQAAAKIAAVINVVTAAAPENSDAAVDAVLSSLVENVTDGEGEDPFGDADQIEEALAAAGDDIEVDTEALATAIVAVAEEVDAVSGDEALSDLEGVQSAVQGALTEAVEDSVGETGETALDGVNSDEDFYDDAVGLRPVVTETSPESGETLTNGSGVTVSGTGRPGTTVDVSLGLASGSTEVDDDGTWSVEFSDEDFVAGEVEQTLELAVTATENDVTSAPAVDPGSFDIDTVPPAAPTITTTGPIGLDDVTDGSYTVEGTAEAGAIVEVVVAGGSTVSVETAENGTWTVDLPAAEGVDELSVTASDALGNTSDAAVAQISLDVTAPEIGDTSASESVNADEADAIAVSGTVTGATSVTVEILSGDEVVLTIADLSLNEGAWSTSVDLSGVEDGEYSVRVTATDGINSTTDEEAAVISLDVTPPDAPGTPELSDGNGDDVINASEISTASVSGTVNANEEVAYSTSKGASGTVTADGDGTYQLSLDGLVESGDTVISFTRSDDFGNVSEAATITVSADLDAPAAPAFDTVDDTIDDTEVSSVILSGTAEVGATVTLSSALFDADVEVVADGSGNWATDALDLSSNADDDYTITATARDAAGNESGSAEATRTVDAVADPDVVITLDEGETDGTFVLLTSDELSEFDPDDGNEPSVGNIAGVPEGTEVTIVLSGERLVEGSFEAFSFEYQSVTNADGDYEISVLDSDVLSIATMRSAGTLEVSAAGTTATFPILANGNLGVDDGLIAVGTTVVEPSVDFAAAFASETGLSEVTDPDTAPAAGEFRLTISDGAVFDGGTAAVVGKVETNDNDFSIIGLYDGLSTDVAKFYAFDGGLLSGASPVSVQALVSSLLVTDDAVYVQQSNISGTLGDPADLQQSDAPLFTVFKIPAGSVFEAIPEFGEATNLNDSADGVTSFDFDLSEIFPDYDGAGVPGNIVFLPEDLPTDDSGFLTVIYAENLDNDDSVELAFLVKTDVNGNTVSAVQLDESQLVSPQDPEDPDSPLSFDSFLVFDAIERDEDGNPVTLSFPQVALTAIADDAEIVAFYDFELGQLGTALTADDNTGNLIVTNEGFQIIDGGSTNDFNTVNKDDDVIVVGNLAGDEGSNVNIDVSGNTVSFTLDEAFAQSLSGTFDLNVDFFLTGASVVGGTISYGDGVNEKAASVSDTSDDLFDVQRFSIAIDPDNLTVSGGKAELFSFEANGVDGSSFFGIGFNNYDDDFNTVSPEFDGYIKVGGVDESASKVVVLKTSGGFGGQDIIVGLDPDDGDQLILQEQFSQEFSDLRGEGVEFLNAGETVSPGGDTGILILDGATSPEEADFLDRLNNDFDMTGVLDGESFIVLAGDGEEVNLWKVGFEDVGGAVEAVSTDNFGEFRGLNSTDLSKFSDDNLLLDFGENPIF